MPQREVSLPEELTRKLRRLANHVRKLSVVRGLGLTAITFVLCLTVSVIIDLFWELPLSIRIGLLGLAVLTVLVTFWRNVVTPGLRRFSPNELASIVEQSHPELMERLSSTIELNDPNVPDAHKGSTLMRELLTKQTIRRIGKLNFTQSVSPDRSQKIAFLAVAAVVLSITPFLFFPSGYSLMVSRFFVPWGNFHSPGNLVFDVDGGDRVVARGKDVPIEVKVGWRKGNSERPETVWLNWTDTTGDTDSRRMEFDSQTETYVTNIPHVFHGFEFNVSARRSRSRNFQVNVVEAPTLTAATLDVEPPVYTGLNAKTIDGVVGDIEVFERSRLNFRLEFNKPMAGAELVWLNLITDPPQARSLVDDDGSEDSIASPSTDQPLTVDFKIADDRKSGTLQLSTVLAGPFAIRLTDEHGLHNGDEPQRLLIVTADQPPVLEVAGSERPQEARPSDVVPIMVMATDDIGLGALELHYDLFRGEETVVPVETKMLGPSITHRFELDLAALGMPEGAVLKYRIRAADERPIPSPNEVWSEPRLITVSRNAPPPGSAEVAERQRVLKQKLQDIRSGVTENRDRVAALQKDAESDLKMQLDFEKGDQIRPLSQQQMELSRQLENLADEFSEHPLYANLVPAAQQIAREDLPTTSRKIADSVDAELREKAITFKQENSNLSQVEAKLLTMENQFDQLAKLELDLLELNRLAQKASQLADAAADLDLRRNESPPPGETPPQKKAREQKLTEDQQLLAQEQQRLAQELNDLLDRRPELLEAARQGQLDQLAKLAKEASALAEPQDRLAEVLENETPQANASRPMPDNASNSTETPEPKQQPNKPLSTLQQQQRLAATAAQTALDIAREAGAESEAARQATEFARQATDSARQAMVGQLDEAGEAAQNAAETAQVAAEHLRSDEDQQSRSNSQFARQLDDLAKQQQQLSAAFEQMANSPSGRRNAQQQGQQQLAVAANDLAQRLAAAARRLTAKPLNLNREGQRAEQAQQSTQQGQQAMQQATKNLQQGDTDNAAQSAREAAEALRQAARQAGGVTRQQPNRETPVPSEVGSQVADAAQQLEQAGQQLAQQDDQQGQQSEQNSEQQNGNSKNGQQGQQSGKSNQSQQASSQSGQNGQQQSSSLSRSAQSLRQAAQSLAQAAQRLQPNQGNPGSQQNSSDQQNANSQTGQPGQPGDASSGIGTQATLDMRHLENELQKLTGRNWGQLPGKLRTEILQASRRKPDGDYARLIKLYFQEIAKSRPKSTSPNSN